jgi:hypothetical protein
VLTRRTVGVATAAALGWIGLCEAIDLASRLVSARGPAGVYAPIWDATALICFGLLLVAGVRFALRAGSEDVIAKLLAGAGILLAAAELKTLAMPVVPGDWLMPSDALRAGAFAAVIVVSAILYRRSVHELAQRARTAERTRIAHDLHDSLAQDLACIAAHSARLAREFGAEHPLTLAARRVPREDHRLGGLRGSHHRARSAPGRGRVSRPLRRADHRRGHGPRPARTEPAGAQRAGADRA